MRIIALVFIAVCISCTLSAQMFVDFGDTQGVVLPIKDTMEIEDPAPGTMTVMYYDNNPGSETLHVLIYNGMKWVDVADNGNEIGRYGNWAITAPGQDTFQLKHETSGNTVMKVFPGEGDTMSVILGGPDNSIENDPDESFSFKFGVVPPKGSTISGGVKNRIRDLASGSYSSRSYYTTIPGGQGNASSGNWSLAAGFNARARHPGSFIWNDHFSATDSLVTTGPNQFLINAAGGVGINTDSPTASLTVKGNVDITGNGFGLTFPDGTTQTTTAVGGNSSWSFSGNNITAGQFIGKTNSENLVLKTNNQEGLWIIPVETSSQAVNMEGGHSSNSITNGVIGATISGGGPSDGNPHSITAAFGTIGGGEQNAVNGPHATISGGAAYLEETTFATVGGGSNNFAGHHFASIGGGQANLATGMGSSVMGGFNNIASGGTSIIPGGADNEALGESGFAAGATTQAMHDSSFVWADFSNPGFGFSSSAANEFNVRAAGGTWIFSDNSATAGVLLTPGSGSWISASSVHLIEDFEKVNTQNILEKVSTLDIRSWQYKSEEDGIRHLGSTSQDFYATFGFGSTKEGIATVDVDGVALAAIQALKNLSD